MKQNLKVTETGYWGKIHGLKQSNEGKLTP